MHYLANLGVHLLEFKDGSMFVQEVVKSSFGAKVKEEQVLDPKLAPLLPSFGSYIDANKE